MIKSFLKYLGVSDNVVQGEASEEDTESIRHIISSLDEMEPGQAHYVALYASILSRVAHADLHMSAEETRAIEKVLIERMRLEEAQAVLVTEISKNQNKLLGGVENYLITREYANWSKPQQRMELLEALFAVAAAEEGISAEENEEIRKIAEEIGLQRHDFLAVRSQFKSELNVLKDIPPA